MKKVFIDGSSGTTGLRIRERLSSRDDIEILSLSEEKRHDLDARKEAINSCDAAFFCLPDAAAIEAAELVESEKVVILDTSTAHRVSPGWVYGFPELGENQRDLIAASRRIAVPGCHASGFIALVSPLTKGGILRKDARLTAYSITGYSGGGKNEIARYNAPDRSELLSAPRHYTLGQKHKHLPEMCAMTGIISTPAFCPVVCDFYSGMVVTVTVFKEDLVEGMTADDVKNAYAKAYTGPVVRYRESMSEDGYLSACALSGRDSMEISVEGNDERILLIARYDNLGKGASGAAIECMNIALGFEDTKGMEL